MSTATIALAAFALTIAVQAAAMLMWGAALSQRVRQLEDDVRRLKALPEKIARVEERANLLRLRTRGQSA